METKKENLPDSKNGQNPNRAGKSKFENTERDEATLGVSRDRETNPGLAEGDQPTWQPPESIPEPRPAEPILNPTQQSNRSTNTNSPT